MNGTAKAIGVRVITLIECNCIKYITLDSISISKYTVYERDIRVGNPIGTGPLRRFFLSRIFTCNYVHKKRTRVSLGIFQEANRNAITRHRYLYCNRILVDGDAEVN